MNKKFEIFLDSGAFSAYSQGITLDIDQYIEFIKKYKDKLEVYCSLDVIGDPEASMRNQKYMEDAGLNPLPVFHYGEPLEIFKNLVQKYDYVGVGGMVGSNGTARVTSSILALWLDDLFSNYICDKDGISKVKVHGFGVTSVDLLIRYPWYSVDSTTWAISAGMGLILVPIYKNNRWNYNKGPWTVGVSNRNTLLSSGAQVFRFMSPLKQKLVIRYIEDEMGYKMGKSRFEFRPADCELNENELPVGKVDREKNQRCVEVIEEMGVSNNYMMRKDINSTYLLQLEKYMPEWPWPFKVKRSRGWGL